MSHTCHHVNVCLYILYSRETDTSLTRTDDTLHTARTVNVGGLQSVECIFTLFYLDLQSQAVLVQKPFGFPQKLPLKTIGL